MAMYPGIIDNSVPNPVVETIRSMPNEFHFSVHCLYTALNDPANDIYQNRIWNSSFNVPDPQEPPLFTESVRRALLRLMTVSVNFSTHTIFQSWFVDNKVTRPLVKTLMDVLTASYLMRNFQGYDFLRHCAVMVELSALCFYTGVVETPDYTVGCILYIIKECSQRNTLDWSDVVHNAECLTRGGEDPNVYYEKLMTVRRALLEGYSSE